MGHSAAPKRRRSVKRVRALHAARVRSRAARAGAGRGALSLQPRLAVAPRLRARCPATAVAGAPVHSLFALVLLCGCCPAVYAYAAAKGLSTDDMSWLFSTSKSGATKGLWKQVGGGSGACQLLARPLSPRPGRMDFPRPGRMDGRLPAAHGNGWQAGRLPSTPRHASSSLPEPRPARRSPPSCRTAPSSPFGRPAHACSTRETTRRACQIMTRDFYNLDVHGGMPAHACFTVARRLCGQRRGPHPAWFFPCPTPTPRNTRRASGARMRMRGCWSWWGSAGGGGRRLAGPWAAWASRAATAGCPSGAGGGMGCGVRDSGRQPADTLYTVWHGRAPAPPQPPGQA